MLENVKKIPSASNPDLCLSVIPGHFSSDRFHVNYYIDMTTLKTRMSEAQLVAKEMCKKYVHRIQLTETKFSGFFNTSMIDNLANAEAIDTIICMDGCEVIGAYVADELSKTGISTNNLHKTFYIVSPEFDKAGQMVVRDNIKPMIKGKNVLVILASAMSGRTIYKSIKCIQAYGGNVKGINVIFGAIDEIEGYPVHAVFSTKDLPDFELAEPENCTACKNNEPLTAIVNSYGYSIL
ncbi:MAG: orotate phosphoribosyltransferase [Lachnospiraceae bacterium]|nr:orotate phosphoribosyltransferase [Lachnospiraceae bacterium]